MEYEKEYNKLVGKIKKAHLYAQTDSTRAVLEDIFPELAESEDERIIRLLRELGSLDAAKELYEEFNLSYTDVLYWLEKQKDSVSNNFDDVWDEEDCEEVIAEGQKLTPRFKELLKAVCHAWYDRGTKLEKQKEASKAIEAVDRIDKYIDEHLANAHDMKDSNPDKKYYRGWDDALGKMSGILQDVYSGEKQKENPKSADSIPSDCISDAKCEDRWHKVGDSLPDNPREVLCKDAAGNYFIGRYYSDEGWEISNYDDEDKPHHLNPPVSEWIDFPSEKQKEQKPIDEQFPPLEGLDAIKAKYYDDGFKNGFDEGVASVKSIEWSEEDEKMRTNLIELLIRLSANTRTDSTSVNYSYPREVEWLKSLRPRPQKLENWTEEDERKYQCIRSILLTDVDKKIGSWKYFEILEWYEKRGIGRYTNSKPHWKPSEEQMKALNETINILAASPFLHQNDYLFNILNGLREELKKLL